MPDSVPDRTLPPDEAAEGVRQRHIRETRQRVHLAALTLVEEFGSASVTISQIAERSGVSRRTFFRYFRNKEDAVLAGHSRYFDAVRALPLSATCVAEALPAIERIGDTVLSQDQRPELDEHRRIHSLAANDPVIRAYAVAQDRVIADTIRDRLAEALPEAQLGDLELVAELGVMVWRHGWLRWTSQVGGPENESPAESHAAVRKRFRELAGG